MKLYKNKYRSGTYRAKWWDYHWNACYFITLCTHHRIHHFGEIQNGKMCLNSIGTIAHECWLDIPKHFPFVKLDAHIVMPNHVHGILIIDKPDEVFRAVIPKHVQHSINKFGPQSKNLASIVRGYKVGVTKGSRLINPDFKWQPKYHDHIIRHPVSFDRIQHYIIRNPEKWGADRFG